MTANQRGAAYMVLGMAGFAVEDALIKILGRHLPAGQILLTIDQVVATKDAYMTLPARKEGIIPGAANLRLARHVGDRIARQAILAERRIDCASAEGRLICDYIVAPEAMDFEVDRLVKHVTGSGMVSAAGNRRAMRIAEEPLDAFRRYMAVYAREQAHCHFSPALISNLEKFWITAAGSRARS